MIKHRGSLMLNPLLTPKAQQTKTRKSRTKQDNRYNRRQTAGCTAVRYNRRQMTGCTAVRYNRSVKPGSSDCPGTGKIRSGFKTKINVTFEPLGQTLRDLNHTFLTILGTYSNQKFQRSIPRFLSFCIWTKKDAKPGKNKPLIQSLARGWLMI